MVVASWAPTLLLWGNPQWATSNPTSSEPPTSAEPWDGVEVQDPAACLPLELKLAPMDPGMLSPKDSSDGETEAQGKQGFLKATNEPLAQGSGAAYPILVSSPVADARPLERSLFFFFK